LDPTHSESLNEQCDHEANGRVTLRPTRPVHPPNPQPRLDETEEPMTDPIIAPTPTPPPKDETVEDIKVEPKEDGGAIISNHH